MTDGEIVKAVRKYAMDHYEEDGWDYVVECWDDSDILKHAAGCTVEQLICKIGDIVGTCDDYRQDIMAEAF